MIPVLIAAIVTGCATAALVALQPHIETYTTRKRLSEAHRASMIERETK